MSKWNLRYHVLVSTKAEARALQPNRGPLSTLTKAKASDWLRALGEEPRVEWTDVEIKSRIQEILDFLEEGEKRLPSHNYTSAVAEHGEGHPGAGRRGGRG